MSKVISFTIDKKNFCCDDSLRDQKHFIVKSVPRSYQVTWDDTQHPMAQINALFGENPKNILLIDEKILALYQDLLTVNPERIFAVKAEESFKTIEGVCHLFDFLYSNQFTKREKLIVVGGGIVQDVGGFVAAAYKRGIQWIYFPTTLLSMCDSCIGSKAGVNYKTAKNQMAIFSAPTQVIINPLFLKTLTPQDIQSGLGEILKFCSMSGDYYLDLYQRYVVNGEVKHFSDYQFLILMGLNIKRSIIEEDEFELHHRKGLNFGHTLGHAIEVMSDYQISHGTAVTAGMMLANELSAKRGYLHSENKMRLHQMGKALLDQTVRKILQSLPVEKLLFLLKNDKKVEGDKINFIMLKQPGEVFFTQLTLDSALESEIEHHLREIFV